MSVHPLSEYSKSALPLTTLSVVQMNFTNWWLHDPELQRTYEAGIAYEPNHYIPIGVHPIFVNQEYASCFTVGLGQQNQYTHLFSWMYVNHLLPCKEQNPSMPYHFQDWPHRYQSLFKSTHLTYETRFELFNFLWANGMPAERAVDCVLRAPGYDYEAHKHVWGLLKDTKLKREILKYKTFIIDDPDQEVRVRKDIDYSKRYRERRDDEADDSCECGFVWCDHFKSKVVLSTM